MIDAYQKIEITRKKPPDAASIETGFLVKPNRLETGDSLFLWKTYWCSPSLFSSFLLSEQCLSAALRFERPTQAPLYLLTVHSHVGNGKFEHLHAPRGRVHAGVATSVDALRCQTATLSFKQVRRLFILGRRKVTVKYDSFFVNHSCFLHILRACVPARRTALRTD